MTSRVQFCESRLGKSHDLRHGLSVLTSPRGSSSSILSSEPQTQEYTGTDGVLLDHDGQQFGDMPRIL